MEKINTYRITNTYLNKYGLKAKKKFGQNFLVDDSILKKIIDAANIDDNELIIEIGPGLGNLTEYILNYANYAILVEIDNQMLDILNDRFSNKFSNYQILNKDILKVDIDEEIANLEFKINTKFSNVKVIANLPYYITTPILFKLLQDSKRINEIVVMVQKEVADRMVAKSKTKDYGVLTLMVQYLTNANIVTYVSRECFIPAPNVDSAVIKLIKNKKFNVENEQLLFELMHKSFALRRKKLVNSLSSNNFMNLDKLQIEDVLKRSKINLNTRAEELDLEDYIEIVENLENK